VAIRKRFMDWLRDPPEPSAGLLLVYTVVVLFAVPFLAPLSNILWWVLIGGNKDPQFSHLARFDFITFTVPFLTLTGLVGAWMSWYRESGRATLVFAALPVVAGFLAYQVADGFRPPPPPRPFDEPHLTFTGGDESRRPFELRNGFYKTRFSVTPRPGEASCRVVATLHASTGGREAKTLLNLNLTRQQLPLASIEGSVFRIDPGPHELAIDEDSRCDWSLALVPVAPPPGPRARP
jgi:hypothetical protein